MIASRPGNPKRDTQRGHSKLSVPDSGQFVQTHFMLETRESLQTHFILEEALP
jgi:hypothetical protein